MGFVPISSTCTTRNSSINTGNYDQYVKTRLKLKENQMKVSLGAGPDRTHEGREITLLFSTWIGTRRGLEEPGKTWAAPYSRVHLLLFVSCAHLKSLPGLLQTLEAPSCLSHPFQSSSWCLAELHCQVWPWQCQAGPAGPKQRENTTENDGIRTDRKGCE